MTQVILYTCEDRDPVATDKESLSIQTRGKIDVFGYASADQFRGITKLIAYGKGGKCEIHNEAIR